MTVDLLLEIIKDTLTDCLNILPFLFLAFLLLEAVEHHTNEKINKKIASSGKAGPAAGAILGCIPQCGFSVFCANLFSSGVITLGTLMAVFLSTSDEALIIILGHPGQAAEIFKLLAVKVIIALVFGYAVDFFAKKHPSPEKHIEDHCRSCGCHEHGGILKPAIKHTVKIMLFLIAIVFALNFFAELVGIDSLSKILLQNSAFQPLIAGLIGLIPNCAASILLTELYLKGALSFASVTAGLCTAAGAGLIVLFKENRNIKENLKIVALLYLISIFSAGIISLFSL